MFDYQLDPNRRRQMDDDISLRGHPFHNTPVSNAGLLETMIRVSKEMCDVVH